MFPGEKAAVEPGLVQEVEVEAAVGDREGDPECHDFGEDPLVVEGFRAGLIPVLLPRDVDHGEGGKDARGADEDYF